jgi:hypothetical protein
MNLTQSISDFLDGLSHARIALRAPSVFLPFAVFAALQCGILLLLASFTSAPLAPVMVPVVEYLGGEDALHYPLHLVRLPVIFGRIYVPLVATVGFALWSLAVWLMVDRHTPGPGARGGFIRALPHVLLVGILFVGVSVGIGRGVSHLAAGLSNPTAAKGLVILGVGVTALVQTFLVYAPVAVRLTGAPAWSAVRASVGYAARHFVPTGLIVTVVLFAHVPLDFILAQAHRVAFRFQPETVFHLLIASIVLEMLTAYLLFTVTAGLALAERGGMR